MHVLPGEGSSNQVAKSLGMFEPKLDAAALDTPPARDDIFEAFPADVVLLTGERAADRCL